MLLIGLDEAGYGPLLGPLCHGYAAFRCADAGEAPDLWRALAPAVSRHPAPDGRLAIDDSKRIFTQGAGLEGLARGVAAFVAQCSHDLQTGDFYASLLPEADRRRLEEDTWGNPADGGTGGRGDGGNLTRGNLNEVCHGQAARGSMRVDRSCDLGAALQRARISAVALGARAMSAKHFNAALRSGNNKADVAWSVIAAQLRALLELAQPGECVHIVIDRQGGRKFYAAQLTALFGGIMPMIEKETANESVYSISFTPRNMKSDTRNPESETRFPEPGPIRVSFLVGADQHSFPVALASMAAKLVREICMERFNAFFRRHAPQLKPTAGYAADAQRFLRETRALRERLSIADEALIRQK